MHCAVPAYTHTSEATKEPISAAPFACVYVQTGNGVALRRIRSRTTSIRMLLPERRNFEATIHPTKSDHRPGTCGEMMDRP